MSERSPAGAKSVRAASPKDIPVTLLAQFWRHAPRYGAGLLLIACYQGAQYGFDRTVEQSVNAAAQGKGRVAVELGMLLVAIAVGAFFVRVLSRVAIFNGGRIAEYELRRVLLDRLQRLGPSFYQRMSTGEIMSRVTNDLLNVRLLLGFGVLNVINTLFGLVSALALMLGYSVKLTLAALAPLPALVLVTFWFSKQMYVRTRLMQDALGRLSERVQSSIAGVRVVRSFGLEKLQTLEFDHTNRDYLEKNLSIARLRGGMGPVMQGFTAIGILVVFWYGGYLMLERELDAGRFLAFYRALSRLTWPLIALGFLVGLVQRGRAAYERLRDIYDARPDIVDGVLTEGKPGPGRLEVRHLGFSFRDRPALDDVSFTLEPGRSLAIMGRTGSGKSTLAALLPRLLPTPCGTVFLDGIDICDLPLSVVRGTIGFAQQTPFLFSTTIARNIGLALDDADSEPSLIEIREAAREARILDEVLGLPDGFDTVVGERGVQLSGGQKQRIALASAFVLAPRVLVLDDPLSAVDAQTEAAILAALDRQRSQRSVILVTHRVAAASRCDRILVLERGEVIEQGTHDELLQLGGVYAGFAEQQWREQELEKLGRGAELSAGVA